MILVSIDGGSWRPADIEVTNDGGLGSWSGTADGHPMDHWGERGRLRDAVFVGGRGICFGRMLITDIVYDDPIDGPPLVIVATCRFVGSGPLVRIDNRTATGLLFGSVAQ